MRSNCYKMMSYVEFNEEFITSHAIDIHVVKNTFKGNHSVNEIL